MLDLISSTKKLTSILYLFCSEAATAYDRASIKFRGPATKVNFPSSKPLYMAEAALVLKRAQEAAQQAIKPVAQCLLSLKAVELERVGSKVDDKRVKLDETQF